MSEIIDGRYVIDGEPGPKVEAMQEFLLEVLRWAIENGRVVGNLTVVEDAQPVMIIDQVQEFSNG